MKDSKIVFELDEKTRIILYSEDPLSELHCCSEEPIFFVFNNMSYRVDRSSVCSDMDTLQIKLDRALRSELLLDQSNNIRYWIHLQSSGRIHISPIYFVDAKSHQATLVPDALPQQKSCEDMLRELKLKLAAEKKSLSWYTRVMASIKNWFK